MNWWGILTLIFCLTVYLAAFRSFDKYEGLGIFLLITGGLALRVFTSSDPFLHEWDERYHALVAKHLSENLLKPVLYKDPVLPYDYTNWTINHIWLHKQPLALWLMAASLKIFGTSAFAVRIPSVVLSAVSVKWMYDIGKYLSGKQAAFLAAFLFSIHGLIIEMAAGRAPTDHIDVTFLFFILLSLRFAIMQLSSGKRYHLLFAGIFLGCAILTKWLTACIVIPLYIILTFEKEKPGRLLGNVLLITVPAAVICLPWQLYILHVYPLEAAWEYHYNSRHFFEALEGHSGNAFYYLDKLRIMYGELVYLPCLLFIYKTVKEKTNYKMWCITAWFTIVYLFFSLSQTKMPAYTLIAAPAVFLITADIYINIKEAARQQKMYMKYFFVLIAWLLLLLPARYTIERVKPFANPGLPAWKEEVAKLSSTNFPAKTLVFGTANPIEMMFYTDVTAYTKIPDLATIQLLKTRGYNVIICK